MSLEIRSIGTPDPNRPVLVFLHEGLGSVSTWRQFPDQLCRRCDLPGLIYSRNGYGQSPTFEQPLDSQFMHRAASQELATLLDEHTISKPLLIGHSDGASISLIYGALAKSSPIAIVAMAPHLFVEPICTESIQALRDSYPDNERLQQSMQRHHRDGEKTFETWTSAWLAPEFADWNIESDVARIQCPVLAIQGKQDQYGTLAQIQRLNELAEHGSHIALDDCRHSPHLDQTDNVLDLIANFVLKVS